MSIAALDYLRRVGLSVEANGDRLRLRPGERVTDAIRQFVRDHRAELLAELGAINDPQPATATPEWRQSRDRYMNHLMTCRACYAPTGRYCQAGAELRATYNATPWR